MCFLYVIITKVIILEEIKNVLLHKVGRGYLIFTRVVVNDNYKYIYIYPK